MEEVKQISRSTAITTTINTIHIKETRVALPSTMTVGRTSGAD
jgi:hypothetical protein